MEKVRRSARSIPFWMERNQTRNCQLAIVNLQLTIANCFLAIETKVFRFHKANVFDAYIDDTEPGLCF